MKDRTFLFTSIKIMWFILIQATNIRVTGKNLTDRIAGGHEIDISQAKFVVQVIGVHSYFIKIMCGGSLVTPRHVITAAHCVDYVKESDITVIGGATYLETDGVRRKVLKKYMMEIWDIAVLKLQTNLKGPNIKTIPLCSVQYQEGDLIKVYGWGKNSVEYDYDLDSQRELREVEVPVMHNRECALYFNIEIPEHYFCAGVPGTKGALEGDSGGPAIFNNQLCGVVSAGDYQPGMGLYIDINYVKSFLKRYINFPGYEI